MSCSGHPVLWSYLGWTVQAYLSGQRLQTDMPWLSCPRCTLLTVPSWLSCHVCPCRSSLPCCPCPVLAALSWLFYHSCLVLVVMFQLSCPVLSFLTILLYLSCHGCPATVVLPQLSSPADLSTWPVLAAFLSALVPEFSYLRCTVHAIMFWLSCASVLSQLFWHGCLAVMSLLSCAGRPVFSVCPI